MDPDDIKTEPTIEISAIGYQVGGSHYKDQGVQPLEATYSNFGYEGLRASVYTKVTREKGSHRQDIQKAIHVLQMQVEFYDRFNHIDNDNSL